MTVFETDYLVVCAGAAGMAFADALSRNATEVVMADRRHSPGGHVEQKEQDVIVD